MAQPKYFDKDILELLFNASKEIVSIRNQAFKQTGIDLLDTDAISSAFIYQIVSQYDSNYNVNFARNGEDAKSLGIVIEQKTTRVKSSYTKTGKLRKNAGRDAAFQFHAMGELDYPRYILAARDQDTLEINRIYDITDKKNRKILLDHLVKLKEQWLEKGKANPDKDMRRDVILLPEELILTKFSLKDKVEYNGCAVIKDY